MSSPALIAASYRGAFRAEAAKPHPVSRPDLFDKLASDYGHDLASKAWDILCADYEAEMNEDD